MVTELPLPVQRQRGSTLAVSVLHFTALALIRGGPAGLARRPGGGEGVVRLQQSAEFSKTLNPAILNPNMRSNPLLAIYSWLTRS